MADRFEKLITKLKDSESEVVKASIVEEIGNTGDHRAIRPLIDALNDTDIRVRWNAIQGLARFGDECMVPLLRTLESSDHFLRRNVVQAVGEISSPDAVQKLVSMLMFDESDRGVLIQVIRALGKIGDDRAVEPLLTVLKTDDWEMKWRAIHALGRIGDPRAIEQLLDFHNDENKDLRWAAAMAVDMIKSRLESPDTAEPEPNIDALMDKPEASLFVNHQEFPDHYLVLVRGEMSTNSLQSFVKYIDELMAISPKSLRLDLSKCEFMDSFALGHLNSLRKKMKASGLTLTLIGMKRDLKRIFEVIRLDKLFIIED